VKLGKNQNSVTISQICIRLILPAKRCDEHWTTSNAFEFDKSFSKWHEYHLFSRL